MTVFKPFVEQQKPVAFPQQCFQSVSAPSAEQEQAVRKQVEIKLPLYDCRKTVNGFSHIGVAGLSPHKDKPAYPHRIIILIFFETPLR
jgi:hypothetical protein